MPTLIVSFGYRHGIPDDAREEGVLVIDVRKWFGRNPYHNPKLRGLRGDHELVAEDILKTPHFTENYKMLKEKVRVHQGDVWLGCTGGHHRSVYLTERIGRELDVPVLHWNYNDK